MLNKDGHEVPDPKPLAMPAGFKRPETLAEQVQRLVRTQMSALAAAEGRETFEESEDFDVEEDVLPNTPFEEVFDPVLGKGITPAEFQQYQEQYRAEYQKRFQDAAREHFRGRPGAGEERPKPQAEPAPKPAVAPSASSS